MSRIIVNEHLSLDGVIQGPGGRSEDTSNGFDLGGWSAVFSDDISGKSLISVIQGPYDLLLGRVTYKIWEDYWPHQSGPIGEQFNRINKYVATKTLREASWQNTVLLNGDVVEQVNNLKAGDGPDLHVWGSGDFLQTLFKNGLVDQLNLWIYPVVLGKGKRLFAGGTMPGNFKLTSHQVSSKGVFISSYVADGAVQLGDIGDESSGN